MDILVAGGTGFVGTHLCAELADRGHDVTAMARSPEDAELPDGVAVVEGDVTDYDAIEGHFAGRDAVYQLVALSPLFKPRGGGEAHFRIHRDGTANCVRAAEEHGVGRFLQQSALDAADDAPTAYLRAKAAAEDVVRDSSLDWTIFRPSLFFGDGGEFVPFTRMLTPPLLAPMPGGGRTRFQPIWIEEGVAVMADALDGGRGAADESADGSQSTGESGTADPERHVGQTYRIGGPAVVTLAEVARLARRAQGIPVAILPLPMSLVKLGASVGEHVPYFPFGLDQYRSLGMDNTIPEDENDVFGVFGYDPGELTTLDEYLGLD